MDAVLLMEFCALNPMGSPDKANKDEFVPRAGCRVEAVVRVLKDLTTAGFHVVGPVPSLMGLQLWDAKGCWCSLDLQPVWIRQTSQMQHEPAAYPCLNDHLSFLPLLARIARALRVSSTLSDDPTVTSLSPVMYRL